MGNQPAGAQAAQQNQGEQASQANGQQGEQSQSFSEQVFGPANQKPTGNQQANDAGVQLPGRKDGETIEAYATRMQSELTRARQDAGKYRTKLRDLTGEVDTGEDGLTEFQRLQKQFETLSGQLNDERNARKTEKISTAIISALAEAGAASPTRTMRLVDTSKELELDDSGTPTPESLGAMVAKLQQEMPTLFFDVRGSGDGFPGNSTTGEPSDFNAMIRARAGR